MPHLDAGNSEGQSFKRMVAGLREFKESLLSGLVLGTWQIFECSADSADSRAMTDCCLLCLLVSQPVVYALYLNQG